MKTFENKYFSKYYQGHSKARDSQRKFHRYFRILRRFQRKGSLLEIGSGYGGFLDLASGYYDVIGIDISEHALTWTRMKLTDYNINLVCASPEALPFSTAFDAVISLDCLEHVPEIDAALTEIGRLQKEGGILMIVVPVYDTFIGKLVQMLDDDITHVHKCDRYYWIEKIEKTGYDILTKRGAWRYLLMGRWYLNFTIPYWKISPALLIIAKRTIENQH